MSKRKQKGKKKTRAQDTATTAAQDNVRVSPPPAQPRRSAATPKAAGPARPLTFGRDTYVWLAIGFGIVFLGLILMSGARPEDPNAFDEDYLYGFRRITLAPLVILGGLGTTLYAILKK